MQAAEDSGGLRFITYIYAAYFIERTFKSPHKLSNNGDHSVGLQNSMLSGSGQFSRSTMNITLYVDEDRKN